MNQQTQHIQTSNVQQPQQWQLEVMDIVQKLLDEGRITAAKFFPKALYIESAKYPNGYYAAYQVVLTKWAPKVLGF